VSSVRTNRGKEKKEGEGNKGARMGDGQEHAHMATTTTTASRRRLKLEQQIKEAKELQANKRVVSRWSVTLPYRKGDKALVHKLPLYSVFLEEGYKLRIDPHRKQTVDPYANTVEVFLDPSADAPGDEVIQKLKRGLKAVVKRFDQVTVTTTQKVEVV
jgi:hypothetical protein